jgi:hypothetical protein
MENTLKKMSVEGSHSNKESVHKEHEKREADEKLP